MARAKAKIPEKNKGKRQMAEQQPFSSVSEFVRWYFPDYYNREYRLKEAKQAFFEKLSPTQDTETSKSTMTPRTR